MKAETEKLRQDLERYRSLLRSTMDRKVAEALRELIAETEEKLRVAGGGDKPCAKI